jgi:pimeloyl-ACP methyl ester carboxylesterase
MKIYEKKGLKYLDEGKGEVILFFHGWGISAFSCQNLISTLALEYRVVAPFFRSFANFKSDEKIIEDLVKTVGKVIVIGHSAGGISAVDFASHFPNKIKALILIDCLGAVVNKEMSIWTKRWFRESLDIIIHPDNLSLTLIKDFLYQMHAPKRLLKDAKYIINTDVSLSASFPRLILWGREDYLIPIENGYNLQKAIGGAALKVVEGNHYWFLKKQKLFLQEIDEFLKSI